MEKIECELCDKEIIDKKEFWINVKDLGQNRDIPYCFLCILVETHAKYKNNVNYNAYIDAFIQQKDNFDRIQKGLSPLITLTKEQFESQKASIREHTMVIIRH